MRQIKLLIKACSVPHLIEGYYGDEYPSKTRYIERLVRTIPGKVAIGCTTLAAFDLYESYIRAHFPDRPVFMVKGDVAFRKRQKIVTEFDSTINGILICTQQSLSSSVNIPTCNDVILESLQWNIPRMEQFYFRFIRLDSREMKNVHYVTYEDSVEQNLMALVLTKERLNEFIKTGEVKEQSEIRGVRHHDVRHRQPACPHAGQRRQDTHQLGKPANNRMNMNRMEMPGSPIPTDKGSPRPHRLSKVRPQAVSGKSSSRSCGIFPKTLHSRDTAPCRGRWNGIPGIHIHKRQVIWI